MNTSYLSILLIVSLLNTTAVADESIKSCAALLKEQSHDKELKIIEDELPPLIQGISSKNKQIEGKKHSLTLHTPGSIQEVVNLVKNTSGRIAILGGGFSMGGQVAVKDGISIDMSKLNRIVNLDTANQTITVEAGATWRQIQEVIDPHGLAIKVMQTYSNFQVGGSLSVNVHGRYVGFGPIISTVRKIKMVLADGRVVTASRTRNSELFYGAIGGYGALGLIVEATLDLARNVKIERSWNEFNGSKSTLGAITSEYLAHFDKTIRDNPAAVMTNADIYPPDYNRIREITYTESSKPLTIQEPFQTPNTSLWRSYLNSMEQLSIFIKRIRERFYEPRILAEEKVVTRNWEASMRVDELTPLNENFPLFKRIFGFANRRAVLQEYFIPKKHLPSFLEEMKSIFIKHKVNVTNVSLRHVPKNDESMLSWSNEEMFAVVIYYSQSYGRNVDAHMQKARDWTQEMLDRVLGYGGSYYLPYQLHARPDQYRKAYPRHAEFRDLKNKVDPTGKFSNYFIDTYVLAQESFHFRDLLESYDRVSMIEFFRNVFGIIKPENHMAAIELAYAQLKKEGIEANDRNMYARLQKVLPDYTNPVSKGVRGILSLRTQQEEMADQTVGLLQRAGVYDVDGYVEIGTPGRYTGYLKGHKKFKVNGPVYVINETKPGLLSPADILERTGGYGGLDPRSYWSTLARNKFVELADYDMISQSDIPYNSVQMASMFIGLHHIPLHKLRPFIMSIHRMIKPGGYFVLRDHDVNTPELMRMAHLAHSTFNAGLGVSYAAEVTEVRNFQPLQYWIQILKESGFDLVSKEGVLQKGDPTKNTLLLFKKNEKISDPNDLKTATKVLDDTVTLQTLPSVPGYFRADSHTHLVVPEWHWVDVYREFWYFQAHTPWFFFPFKEHIEVARKIHQDHIAYAKKNTPKDKRSFNEYVSMDRFLLAANGFLFGGLQKAANLIKWMLRKETPPSQTGFVVEGLQPGDLEGISDGLITQLKQMSDDMTLLATSRQMPFTHAMIELAKKENIRVLQVAGHEEISVLFAAPKKASLSTYTSELKTMEVISSFQFPTAVTSLGIDMVNYSVKIHVKELGNLIRAIEKNNHKLIRVHDY